jgi:hypothetical protein
MQTRLNAHMKIYNETGPTQRRGMNIPPIHAFMKAIPNCNEAIIPDRDGIMGAISPINAVL